MTNEEMHAVLDSLAVGDKVHAWLTGCRPADYDVKSITRGKARHVTIEGARGTVFVLGGGEFGVWGRAPKRGAKPRKVRELVLASAKRLAVAKADAAFAARRLPSGYSIETWTDIDGDIWHRAMFGREPIPRGLTQFGHSDPNDAVIDAWAHYSDTLSRLRKEDIDADSIRTAELRGRLEIAESDARRCRKALQQIGEIIRSEMKSGKALPDDYPPEQVVADVAHAKVLASVPNVQVRPTVRVEPGPVTTAETIAWAE